MARAEPKLSAVFKELVRLREALSNDRQQIATLSSDLDSYTNRWKLTAAALKEKELQFSRLQRCRLCLAENLTPRAREKFVKRATKKRFSSADTKVQVEEEKTPEELIAESLAAMKEGHAPDDEGRVF